MQQQPPQPQASNLPLNAITTEQIQKYLEDNKNLIIAILECKKLGKFQECALYQAVLQKNLMYLAAIADAQPQIPPQNALASNFMPPPQTGGCGGSGQKLPFQFSSINTHDQQQQLLHYQQQQQFQAQMGLRTGAHSGVFGMQSALAANAGGRQGGSEVVYGGDGIGMFFDNGGFRDS